jgi:hypothetical protein
MDGGETVSSEYDMITIAEFLTARGVGVYARALSTGLIQKDVEQTVAIVLARAGAERRKAEANPEGNFVCPFRRMGLTTLLLDRSGDVGFTDQDLGRGDRSGSSR